MCGEDRAMMAFRKDEKQAPCEQMVELIDRNPADACGLETKIAQRQWNKKYSGAPLSKTSWRGVFLFVIERTFRLFFQNSLDKPLRI